MYYIKGLPNSEYVLLNAETGTYLYHENEELLNQETCRLQVSERPEPGFHGVG